MPFFLVEAYKADDQGRDGQGEQEAGDVAPEGGPGKGLVQEEVACHDDGNHERPQVGVPQEVPNREAELEVQ